MDAMQEASLIPRRKNDQFQIGTNFRAWMLRIAHYQVLSYRRNFRKREVFIEDAFIDEMAAEAFTEGDGRPSFENASKSCPPAKRTSSNGATRREPASSTWQDSSKTR